MLYQQAVLGDISDKLSLLGFRREFYPGSHEMSKK